MSTKGPVIFSPEEVKLFKPYFVQWVSKTATPTDIKEALGSQYERFQLYAKIGLTQLKKKKIEDEIETLLEQKKVLTHQLQQIEQTKQQSYNNTVQAITEELGKTKVGLS